MILEKAGKDEKKDEFSAEIIYFARYARQTQARASGADILGCISIKVTKQKESEMEKLRVNIEAPKLGSFRPVEILERLVAAITDIEGFISSLSRGWFEFRLELDRVRLSSFLPTDPFYISPTRHSFIFLLLLSFSHFFSEKVLFILISI